MTHEKKKLQKTGCITQVSFIDVEMLGLEDAAGG